MKGVRDSEKVEESMHGSSWWGQSTVAFRVLEGVSWKVRRRWLEIEIMTNAKV